MGCIWSQQASFKPRHWITIDELLLTVRTGDIFLFSGYDNIFKPASLIIQLGSNSAYSHVGVVVKTDTFGACLWESSTPDGCIDVLTQTNKDGPRLIPLREKLERYLKTEGYAVHYRELVVAPEYMEQLLNSKPSLGEKLGAFLERESPKNFEWDLFSMARSVQPWIPGEILPNGDPIGRFCSELVAETWRVLGYLDVQRQGPSDLLAPPAFAEGNEASLAFPMKIIDGGNTVFPLVFLGETKDVKLE